MNKEPDKGRWDICEQCMGEVWDSETNMSKRVLNYINQNRCVKWSNPYRAAYHIRNNTELCAYCPYRFEHATLNQENMTDE